MEGGRGMGIGTEMQTKMEGALKGGGLGLGVGMFLKPLLIRSHLVLPHESILNFSILISNVEEEDVTRVKWSSLQIFALKIPPNRPRKSTENKDSNMSSGAAFGPLSESIDFSWTFCQCPSYAASILPHPTFCQI